MASTVPASWAAAAQEKPVLNALTVGLAALITWIVQRTIYRLYFHPLAKFPGPVAAAATTQWKAYIEVLLQKSICHVLKELHDQHGESRVLDKNSTK